MSENFGSAYSSIYDEIYRDKSYEAEVDEISSILARHGVLPGHRILDVGCGTGLHAMQLSTLGFQMTGYDRSESMIQVARSKTQELVEFTAAKTDVDSRSPFDAVYSLFDVLSYQVDAASARGFFQDLARWVKPGGLVILDSWYLPGVMADPPIPSFKSIPQPGSAELRRVGVPTFEGETGVTTLKYELHEICAGRSRIVDTEVHKMRAFTLLELTLLANQVGLEVLEFRRAPRFDQTIEATDWHVGMICRRSAE